MVNENDKLAQDVLAAKNAGMSYGQWMALSYVPKRKEVSTEYGIRKCIVCGKKIDPKSRRRIYCSEQCAKRSIYSRN